MRLAYIVLIFTACLACTPRPEVIAIQPFGNINASEIEAVQKSLAANYRSRVVVLPSKKLPPTAYVNIKTPRYRADSLLKYLSAIKPDSVDYILGFTASDISTTKRNSQGEVKTPASRYTDWGIFGLGYRPGPACVISTFRLKHPQKSIFIERLKKVATHEIGHNLGLPHCPHLGCVMEDAAETVKTIDRVNSDLCRQCRIYPK